MLASDCFASNLCCLLRLTGQPTCQRSVEVADPMASCWLTVDKDSSGGGDRSREREEKDKPAVPVVRYLDLMLSALTLI